MASDWTWKNGVRFDAHDVRRAAYHAVFAGACGHVYGCHDIWQMWDESRERVNHVDTPWKKALFFEGATQRKHLRVLAESRPYFSRVPDQKLICFDSSEGREHIQATRDADGSDAFVYVPGGQNVTLDLARMPGETLRSSWFDPRDGSFQGAESFAKTARRDFTPPSTDDWILVLDDAAREYSHG